MKKLLVLLLVFGLTSAVNAAVVGLSVDGTNVVTAADIGQGVNLNLMVISDTDDYPWLMEVSVLTADATLGVPVPTLNAGGMAGIVDYSDATIWDYELSTAGSPGSIKAGIQWNMDLLSTLPLNSVFTVSLGEYGMAPVSTIDFTVVPEPMTVALLGLGGLFLLRRRK